MRVNKKSGSLNETVILTSLDNHRFKDLSENWKRHISRMFKDIKDDDYIQANYYSFADAKPDIEITCKNRKVLLSIKSGHAPEVHSEHTYSFYDFLRGLDVPERIIKIISFYHFGCTFKRRDEKSYTREQIINKYSRYIKEVNDYFNNHDEIVREIIYRCIIRGRTKRDVIDYFYYGNSAKGFLLSYSDIYKLISSDIREFNETIHFKSLTYGAGSRKLDSDRRYVLKIRWPKLCIWYYDTGFMHRYG